MVSSWVHLTSSGRKMVKVSRVWQGKEQRPPGVTTEALGLFFSPSPTTASKEYCQKGIDGEEIGR